MVYVKVVCGLLLSWGLKSGLVGSVKSERYKSERFSKQGSWWISECCKFYAQITLCF